MYPESDLDLLSPPEMDKSGQDLECKISEGSVANRVHSTGRDYVIHFLIVVGVNVKLFHYNVYYCCYYYYYILVLLLLCN